MTSPLDADRDPELQAALSARAQQTIGFLRGDNKHRALPATPGPGQRAPDTVAIFGDWHGNLAWALTQLDLAAEHGIRLLLQLGDFGLFPDADTRHYLDGLAQRLRSNHQTLYWIDGNHDDHDTLAAWPLSDDGVHVIRDSIVHLPRGYRWTWAGTTWLALGGAASVDRAWRVPHVDWWPDEVLQPDDTQQALAGGPVDIMLTHDAPYGVPPLEQHLGHNPHGLSPETLDYAERHRTLLRQVVDKVHPSHLFHGHYHHRYDAGLELEYRQVVRVHGLGCDGDEGGNVTVVDITDTKPLAGP